MHIENRKQAFKTLEFFIQNKIKNNKKLKKY